MGLDLLRPLVSLFLVLNQAGSLTPFHHGFLVPRQLSSTVWDELVPSSLAAASLKTSTKHAPEQSGAARPVFPRELPIFFVKELPLPLGVKSANIIEPRYKRMIAEHSTIGYLRPARRPSAQSWTSSLALKTSAQRMLHGERHAHPHGVHGHLSFARFARNPDKEGACTDWPRDMASGGVEIYDGKQQTA